MTPWPKCFVFASIWEKIWMRRKRHGGTILDQNTWIHTCNSRLLRLYDATASWDEKTHVRLDQFWGRDLPTKGLQHWCVGLSTTELIKALILVTLTTRPALTDSSELPHPSYAQDWWLHVGLTRNMITKDPCLVTALVADSGAFLTLNSTSTWPFMNRVDVCMLGWPETWSQRTHALLHWCVSW